jgi:hypothetical protein
MQQQFSSTIARLRFKARQWEYMCVQALGDFARSVGKRIGYVDSEQFFEQPHQLMNAHLTTARFYTYETDEELDNEVPSEPSISEMSPPGDWSPIRDAGPQASGPAAADMISFAADMLQLLGVAGLVPWGRWIYGWLRRNEKRSIDVGATLPVALWHLSQQFTDAVIDEKRYDVFSPLRDSQYANNYSSVYWFRFYDRVTNRVYCLEVDSAGTLRSHSTRNLGAFD